MIGCRAVFLFVVLLACQPPQIFSQQAESLHLATLSAEIGKTGTILNAVYDHQLKKQKAGFRVFAGSNFSVFRVAATGGIGGYKLFGGKNNYFEAGIDLQYLWINDDSDDQRGFNDLVYPAYARNICPFMNLGYRGYGKWLIFRMGISPGIINREFVPGGYLGIGARLSGKNAEADRERKLRILRRKHRTRI